jgi:hypothetical protein
MGGPRGIPFSAIDRFADRFEVDDFGEFLAMIRAMDRAFLRAHEDSNGR